MVSGESAGRLASIPREAIELRVVGQGLVLESEQLRFPKKLAGLFFRNAAGDRASDSELDAAGIEHAATLQRA